MLPLKAIQMSVHLCGEILRSTGTPPDEYARILEATTMMGVELQGLCPADLFYVAAFWTSELNTAEAEMFWPAVSAGRWLEGLENLQRKLSNMSEHLSWWVAVTIELMSTVHPAKKTGISIQPSLN